MINTKKIYCNVDEVPYQNKAEADKAIGGIVNRMKCDKRLLSMSAESLSRAVTQGYSFTAAALKGTTAKDFVSQSLAVLDIDNKRDDIPVTTVEAAIQTLEAYGIKYSFMYYSYSHTTSAPKFRIVCVLDEAVTNPDEAIRLNKYLISLFPQADEACHNLDRLYYGTDKGLATEVYDRTTKIILPAEPEPDPATGPPKEAPARSSVTAGAFDLTQAIQSFDLAGYIRQTTGAEGERKGKDVLFNPCPVCGHKDDFYVDTERNIYKCHSASNNSGGNILNYLMNTRNWDIKAAREYFIYDIMKQDRQAQREAFKQAKRQERVEEQTGSADFKIDNYIYDDKINCALLAEFIKERERYIFVRDHAKENVQHYLYKNGYYSLIADLEFKSFIKNFIPLEMQKMEHINEAFNLISLDDKFLRRSQIDNNENIINFKNGVLHLDTMELKPHSPDYICTKRIPHNFVPDAPRPDTGHFDKYMAHLTTGDKGKASLILQVLGMAISNIKGYRPKKGLFMFGEGDTGKSVIRGLAAHLVGEENNSGINLETLEARFGTSVIYGKRLVGSPDMSFMTVKELHAFKMITGGDDITAEYKRENAFTYRFDGVVWFCMNELPKFGGDKGDHVYDRMMMVECNPKKPEFLDRELPEKLLTEIEYIISLAIKELQKVIDNGYNYVIPQSVRDSREYYKKQNSSFLLFFDECTTPRLDGKIYDKCTRKKFYDVYAAWCKDNNRGVSETKPAVLKMLESMGKAASYQDKHGNRYYRDFTLTLETKRDYSKVYGYDDTMNIKN
ncbi:MAG: phage/plasmid primase, P4 family [Treponema sp.]|nr:phage/plasmid primase, P4 family [Treponema sp.]